MSPELAALADDDADRMTLLSLADGWCQSGDDGERVTLSGAALRVLEGTPGERIIAWQDLREAVESWHGWDLVADSKGRCDYLSLPRSREEADRLVLDALDCAARLAVAS